MVHQPNEASKNVENLKIGAALWYHDCLTSENIQEKLKQWQNDLKKYLNLQGLKSKPSLDTVWKCGNFSVT